ncbi:hypothetical protein ABPG77_000035 [Micractinium sp. CCAP 211/92]
MEQQGAALPWAQQSVGEQHGGAALPWAQQTAQDQQGPEAVDPDLPATLGLSVGDRVEVLWEVTVNETNESTRKWWGAELSRREDGTDGEGRTVYVLRYDPDKDMGFDEHEECCVTFLEDHYLWDLGQDEELPWRQVGHTWEPPPPLAGDGAAEGAEVFSLADLAADIETRERRRGRTLDEEAAAMLSEMPQERAMAIASGFRSFSEAISTHIAGLYAQHGSDYVVTAADVQAATAAARAALRQGGAL